MKVFLLLGGAFALKNSHSLLLGIISPAAAQSAQGSVLAGVAMGMGATRMIKGKIGSMGRSGGAKGGRPAPTNNSSAPSVQHQNAADVQKYSG
jgi:hypothetical protein